MGQSLSLKLYGSYSNRINLINSDIDCVVIDSEGKYQSKEQ